MLESLPLAPPSVTSLSEPERAVMARDGLLVRAGPDAWLEADLAGSLLHRARLVARLVPRRATVVGHCAVWVYLGGRLQLPLTVAVPHGTRTPQRRGILAGQCLEFSEQHVWHLGQLRVLDPVGAALQVARDHDPARAGGLIAAFVARYGIDNEALLERLSEQPGRAGNARATRTLRALWGSPQERGAVPTPDQAPSACAAVAAFLREPVTR